MQKLIEKYLNRTISFKERRRLKKWVLANNENLSFFKEQIKNRADHTLHHQFDAKDAFKQFINAIDKSRLVRRKRLQFLRYAAVFVGIFATASIIFIAQYKQNTDIEIADIDLPDDQIVITLSDGSSQIISSNNEEIVKDRNGAIIAKKQSDGLDFRQSNSSLSNNLLFNEVYIPFGQKLKLILSDGTKVWLNSGSRFRFPKNLNTAIKNRVVYLEGEAYFDVAKDKKRPFIVNAENLNIKVLGTQFNVSAYKSDSKIATTLVEGSVNVYDNSNPDEKTLLIPNYQATFLKENGTIGKQKVNIHTYTGWMDGRLVIDNLSFKQIIKKLERGYNLTIINNVKSLNDEVYNGEFNNESIEDILNTITSSTPFTYTIDNNVITITK